jgi:hypothetical protein
MHKSVFHGNFYKLFICTWVLMLKNLDLGSKNMKPEGLKTLARAHLHNKIRF